MSRHGNILNHPGPDGLMQSSETGLRYKEEAPGVLRCSDLEEETTLPAVLATGVRSYDVLRSRCDLGP